MVGRKTSWAKDVLCEFYFGRQTIGRHARTARSLRQQIGQLGRPGPPGDIFQTVGRNVRVKEEKLKTSDIYLFKIELYRREGLHNKKPSCR